MFVLAFLDLLVITGGHRHWSRELRARQQHMMTTASLRAAVFAWLSHEGTLSLRIVTSLSFGSSCGPLGESCECTT